MYSLYTFLARTREKGCLQSAEQPDICMQVVDPEVDECGSVGGIMCVAVYGTCGLGLVATIGRRIIRYPKNW